MHKDVKELDYPVYLMGGTLPFTPEVAGSMRNVTSKAQYANYTRYANNSLNMQIDIESLDARGECRFSTKKLFEQMLLEQKPSIRESFTWKGTLTIDGMPFHGTGIYYVKPLSWAWFELFSDQTALGIGARGVGLDDLIQVLEALRVPNRKQAE